MRLIQTIAVFVVSAVSLLGQSSSPAISRAQQEIERVRPLVEAGALPKKALADAQSALDELQDKETLEASLYGHLSVEELTEQQADEMVAAAQRYVDHQQKKVDDATKLVDAGVVGKATLDPFLDELKSRQEVYEQAARRAGLLKELAAMVHTETEAVETGEDAPIQAHGISEHYDGDGSMLKDSELKATVLAFEKEFDKPLPISARGETALHQSFGFDHRGRVDVALTPDSKEGLWLRHFLESQHVPYFAFRAAVPGKSTGAHIHIGPQSVRIRRAD